MLQQAAPTKATILITGESGTGKEIVARAIHQISPRRSGPFFAVNCAAMPESLIESELFGHEKGAFTGAVERRAGCFELARGGTLLLDEIGDMPMNTQAKLLRILEEGRVRRLGSAREIELDVRVLASTNKNLRDVIAKGAFREDLFFRLNVFEVHLPPLRERKEDIPLLVRELLSALNRKHDCRVTEVSLRGAGDFRPLRLARQRTGVAQPAGAGRDSGGQRIGDARPPAARFRRTSGHAAAHARRAGCAGAGHDGGRGGARPHRAHVAPHQQQPHAHGGDSGHQHQDAVQ